MAVANESRNRRPKSRKEHNYALRIAHSWLRHCYCVMNHHAVRWSMLINNNNGHRYNVILTSISEQKLTKKNSKS